MRGDWCDKANHRVITGRVELITEISRIAVLGFLLLGFISCTPPSLFLVDTASQQFFAESSDSSAIEKSGYELRLYESGSNQESTDRQGASVLLYRIIEAQPEVLANEFSVKAVIDPSFFISDDDLEKEISRRGLPLIRSGAVPPITELTKYIASSELKAKQGLILISGRLMESETSVQSIREGFQNAGLAVTLMQKSVHESGLSDLIERSRINDGAWDYIILITDIGLDTFFTALGDLQIELFVTHGKALLPYDDRIRGSIDPDIGGMLKFLAEVDENVQLGKWDEATYYPAIFSARQ